MRRLVTTLLSTLLLVAGLAAPATADPNTFRDHDGTAERSVLVDESADWASKDFRVLDGMLTAQTATVSLYARAEGCTTSGNSQRIRTPPGKIVAEFDPCAVFPTGSYGWASFPVPMAYLSEWRIAFRIEHFGPAGQRAARYAIDADTDRGLSFAREYTGGTPADVDGELMWDLTLDGSTPAVAATPKTVDFGLIPPGTPVTRTVTVTSTGTATASPSVAISGPAAADYALTTDTCTGAALPPGATCTVAVTVTPATIGTRAATLTVGGNVTARTVALTAQGRSLPPVSAITAPANGALLLPGERFSGTVTDDLAVAYEEVTYVPTVPGLATVTALATLSCDAARTACAWSAAAPVTPGRYTATARGTDVQGIAETPGPSVTVVVV